MMSGQRVEKSSLSARVLDYYREVVAVHSDDSVLKACLICRVPRCQDWRFASERLMVAGESPGGTTPHDDAADTESVSNP